MGILVTEESRGAEMEEFRQMVLYCAAVQRRKDGGDSVEKPKVFSRFRSDSLVDRLVCVTSGVSYLGIAIVNQLLSRGYSVRVIVDDEEDVEILREMEVSSEMTALRHSTIEVAMANLSDVDGLAEAFEGCGGVFHTAAFVDPAGFSGYTKSMVDVEVKACENVMKACGMSSSVRNCVLTSSLVTCIWQGGEDSPLGDAPGLIDHKCWSDESLCIDKKLWYALGKLRAEKAAFEIAKRTGLKLAAICPGLITGRDFCLRNPTATIAYLKGVGEMYPRGLLATVDIDRLAKAQVSVFEGMKKSASGRYICFDRVVESEDGIRRLAQETGMDMERVTGAAASSSRLRRFRLSNSRLVQLMVRTERCNQSEQ